MYLVSNQFSMSETGDFANSAEKYQEAAAVWAHSAKLCVKQAEEQYANLAVCENFIKKVQKAADAAADAAQNAQNDVDNASHYAKEANKALNEALNQLAECRRIYNVQIKTMVANHAGSRYAKNGGAFAKKARKAAVNAELTAKKITQNSDVGEAAAAAADAVNQTEIAKHSQLEYASIPLWRRIFSGYPERVIERFLPQFRKMATIYWAFGMRMLFHLQTSGARHLRLLPFLFANLKISWKN